MEHANSISKMRISTKKKVQFKGRKGRKTRKSRKVNKIIIPKGKRFLSDAIANLPAGIIDKRFTGIGATHLELTDASRHSIIVVPTRALAITKSHKTGYYCVMGGMSISFDQLAAEIVTKLRSQTSKKVKILVVIDSLPNLLTSLERILGEEVYTHFFILFDEVDIIQEDINYRHDLGVGLDYYLKFPNDRRALISATLNGFSDSELAKERVTLIEMEDYERKELQVFISTIDPIKTLLEQIKLLNSLDDDNKIIIALNSIGLIRKIIDILKLEPNQCSIFCSSSREMQEDIEKYYRVLKNGLLPTKINFLTSSYYAGVDIFDEAHMIVFADPNFPKEKTVLTIPRIIQFFGRSRHPDSTLTIILGTNKEVAISYNGINEKVSLVAQTFRDVLNAKDIIIKIAQKDPCLEPVFLDWAGAAIYREVPLIKYKDSRYDINYLALDYFRIRAHSMEQLYACPCLVKNALSDLGLYECIIHLKEDKLTQDELEVIFDYKGSFNEDLKAKLIEILKGNWQKYDSNSETHRWCWDLYNRYRGKSNWSQIYAEALAAIESQLPKHEMKKVKFKAEVYSLPLKEQFWSMLYQNFEPGERYERDTFEEIIKAALSLMNKSLLEEYVALRGRKIERVQTICNVEFKKHRSKSNYLFKGFYESLRPIDQSMYGFSPGSLPDYYDGEKDSEEDEDN